MNEPAYDECVRLRAEIAADNLEIARLREALEKIEARTRLDDEPIGPEERFVVSVHEIARAALSQERK